MSSHIVVQKALHIGSLLQVRAPEERPLDALQNDGLELRRREREVLCVVKMWEGEPECKYGASDS